ncbi:uncharacterized protein LOC132062212 [Lycium ferocissimum]|uniref:uncharacterized protein LOC132062212 n=1 Tax=Lycium ferocissimum TaxID=112874 RepID=UPI0028158EF4|nr:uncharacterized protein LOC132062212 [Lycium ferocissimum]
MESRSFRNIKLEKANAMLRYKKRQRVTTLFRYIEFCISFVVISRFSTEYFRGLSVTLISPRFVFVLVNAIVIILFFKSGQSSTKDGSTNNSKIDMYDEYKQKCSMNKETYCEQSILVEEAYCKQIKKQRKQSILVEKRIRRIHSDNSISLSHDEKKPRKKMIRSATVGCLKVINTDSVKPTTTTMTTNSYPEDGMSSEEFKNTVEAFIARKQRLLREEEFSAVVSS